MIVPAINSPVDIDGNVQGLGDSILQFYFSPNTSQLGSRRTWKRPAIAPSHYDFAEILAQVSFNVTMRLNTGAFGLESLVSTQ